MGPFGVFCAAPEFKTNAPSHIARFGSRPHLEVLQKQGQQELEAHRHVALHAPVISQVVFWSQDAAGPAVRVSVPGERQPHLPHSLKVRLRGAALPRRRSEAAGQRRPESCTSSLQAMSQDSCPAAGHMKARGTRQVLLGSEFLVPQKAELGGSPSF